LLSDNGRRYETHRRAALALTLAHRSPPSRQLTRARPSQKYCVTCHNERAKSGGLALDGMDYANCRRAPRSGKIDQETARRHDAAARRTAAGRRDAAASLVSWLTTTLDHAAQVAPNPAGRCCTAESRRVRERDTRSARA